MPNDEWVWNSPPNWPEQPQGWEPPEGWAPDAAWGEAPEGWTFWVPAASANVPPVVPTSSAQQVPKHAHDANRVQDSVNESPGLADYPGSSPTLRYAGRDGSLSRRWQPRR